MKNKLCVNASDTILCTCSSAIKRKHCHDCASQNQTREIFSLFIVSPLHVRYLSCFCCRLLFLKMSFRTLSECQTVWINRCPVGPDLGPNCLEMLSADVNMYKCTTIYHYSSVIQ